MVVPTSNFRRKCINGCNTNDKGCPRSSAAGTDMSIDFGLSMPMIHHTSRNRMRQQSTRIRWDSNSKEEAGQWVTIGWDRTA